MRVSGASFHQLGARILDPSSDRYAVRENSGGHSNVAEVGRQRSDQITAGMVRITSTRDQARPSIRTSPSSIEPSVGTLKVSSDNAAYANWPDCDSENTIVLGRGVWAGRPIREQTVSTSDRAIYLKLPSGVSCTTQMRHAAGPTNQRADVRFPIVKSRLMQLLRLQTSS